MRTRKPWLSVAVSLLSAAAIVGCGSSSSSSSSASSAAASSSTSSSSGASSSIAAMVPSSIKSKGTLTVAADASYAPNEFIGPDGHTVVGMDADLSNALAALMGLKANIVNATFDTIIPGLATGESAIDT
jgi:polar amino acid transport system substrate-binding protein